MSESRKGVDNPNCQRTSGGEGVSLDSVTFTPEGLNPTDVPNKLVDDDGEILGTREAVGTYASFQCAHIAKGEAHKSDLSRWKSHYGRIMGGTRDLFSAYESPTTVMLTRRQSPSNDMSLWAGMENLAVDGLRSDVTESIRKQLRGRRGLDFEYVSVVGVTGKRYTVHEHDFYVIDDPDNVVNRFDFKPAVNQHVEKCPTASWDGHSDQDAIRMMHSPGDSDMKRASTYVARNMTGKALAEYADDDRPNPPTKAHVGGALRWARPDKEKWTRFSSGWPAK